MRIDAEHVFARLLLKYPRRAATVKHSEFLQFLRDRYDGEAIARRDIAEDDVDIVALHEVPILRDLLRGRAGLVDVFHLDLGPAEADLIVGGWELAGVEVLNQNFRGVASRYSERRGCGTGQEGNDTDLDQRRRGGLLRGRDGERRQRQGGCEAERVSAFPTAMCHRSVPPIGCRQSVCAATTIVRYFSQLSKPAR